MCRLAIPANNADTCLLCATTGQKKCNHELAVCSNQAIHPNWKSYYYKNAGGISTFQGCGFCKNARKSGHSQPARTIQENPGWPGCCYPPTDRFYHWIPPQDWEWVALYHHMEIPPTVRSALDNMHKKSRENQRPSIEIAATGRTSQQPVPIPKANTANGSQPRSYSPGGLYSPPTPGSDRSRHRGSVSSNNSSNSSGSPPSSTGSNGSRRRERDFDGSDRSSPISPVRSNSQDEHRPIKSSSSAGSRRTDSPSGSPRDKDSLMGKRRSNSDPKYQHQQQQPPSAYDRQRERDGIIHRGESPTLPRELPTQKRPSPPASTISSNHPYSNPYSPASSSMKRLNQIAAPSPPRQPLPAPVPRSRENNDPSISSVMANMANMNINGLTPAALARIQMDSKRGVIPPHVRKAGSVVSAASGSSSSTNSSAREGTVISDGAFTDYLSDDSDFDLQRQAEVEAENLYQEALRKHEENEFREARESLANASGLNRRYAMPNGASRIRV